MSLQSWRDEFYPTEAVDCPANEAIAHSLRKWIGLRVENRRRHEVRCDEATSHLVDGAARFPVNSTTCALCASHYDDSADDAPCAGCPLAVSRDGYSCDTKANDERQSPWAAWFDHENPEPMIAALEKALQAGSAS